MADYFSRALRAGADDGELIEAQSPIVRPDPIVRPGEERAAPRQPQFAPQQRPAARQMPASGGMQQPSSAAPMPQDAPIERPSVSSGEAAGAWVGLMQKHAIPQEAWTGVVDQYYRLRDNPNDPLDGVPPPMAQDLRAFAQKFPKLGGRAPEATPSVAPARPMPPGLPPAPGGEQATAAPVAPPATQRQAPAEPPPDYFGRAIRGAAPDAGVTSKDLIYAPARTLGFVDQAKGSFAPTTDKWKRMVARSLYPNEPPEQAASRIQQTKDGRWYHVGPDGKAYEVQPPSGLGRLQNIGGTIGGALPVVAGGAAGLAALPLGGIGSIGAAGIGGFAGETARQYIGNQLEDSTPDQYSPARAALEGVSNAVGQGVGVGINKLMTRANPVDIGHYDPAATQALYDSANRLGVRLTPAEATGMNSLIGDQKRLQASPRAANDMTRFAEERNQEVATAWERFLLGIASPRDASALGRQASGTAERVLEGAQAQRTAAVEPFYRAAEQQIATVNPGQIVRFVEQALPHAKGSERAALQFVQSQLQTTDRTAVDASFRGLNGAKMAIDAVLENPDLAAKQGLDRHAHRTLQAIREMIVGTIDNAPGAGGAAGPYAAGRTTYGTMTEAYVTPVQELLAPLLRANPANSSIVRTAQAMLDPATRSPEIVRQARTLITQQDPRVWDGIVRQFLQEHAVQALQENAKGSVSNAGGNIAKRIGNDKVEQNLRAAMNPQQFQAYRELVDVFRATGRALDINSDTAFKQEAIKQAKNAAGGSIARLLRNTNPARLLENTADWFANANYERQAAALARIVTQGDASAIQQLRQLRVLSPSDQRRNVIIGHLLEQSGEFAAQKLTE